MHLSADQSFACIRISVPEAVVSTGQVSQAQKHFCLLPSRPEIQNSPEPPACGPTPGFSQTSLAIHQPVQQQPTAKAVTSSLVSQLGKAALAPGKSRGGFCSLHAGNAAVRDDEEGACPSPTAFVSLSAGWLNTNLSPLVPGQWLHTFLLADWEDGGFRKGRGAALLCQGMGIFSSQLDLQAPNARTWLQDLAPYTGSRSCTSELVGGTLYGLRLLSRAQLTQGPLDTTSQQFRYTSPPLNLCAAKQPDPPFRLSAPELPHRAALGLPPLAFQL